MLTGIDHVILAVGDLDGAAAELERELGLHVAAGGRHDAHGTHNRLAWLGDSYVELMAVFDERRAADSWWGREALAVSAHGGGWLGMALASDDLAADVERLRAAGSSITDPIDGERARADGEVVRWRIARLTTPMPELGLLFLIEHDTSAAEWRPEERRGRAERVHPLGTPATLLRVELAVSQLRPVTQQLLGELGLLFRPSLGGGGARDTSIGSHVLRVARRSLPPARVVIVAGSAPRNVDLLGCRWQLVSRAGGGG